MVVTDENLEPSSVLTASAAFLASCKQQSVRLDPFYKTLLTYELSPGSSRHISQVVDVVRVLAREYGRLKRPIASGALALSELPDDVPSQLLGQLINATIDPRSTPAADYCVTNPAKSSWPTCSDVEVFWATTADAMADRRPGSLPLVQIIADTKHNPVVIRKGRGLHATGLLLAHVAIGKDGIVYPPGSIVQIDVKGDWRKVSASGKLQLPPSGIDVQPLGQVTGLRFERLSPFSVPPGMRTRHFGDDPGITASHTIEEMRKLAADYIKRNAG
jgi:hypothetical protein